MGYDTSEYSTFDDMQNHWASQAVQACVSHNTISGVGDNLFAPDNYITYEQADKIIMLAKAYTREYRIERMGGYPWGYMKYATWLGLPTDFVDMTNWELWKQPDIPMKRMNVAMMIYNTTFIDQWIENDELDLNIDVTWFTLKNYTPEPINEFRIYDMYDDWSDNLLMESIPAYGEGTIFMTEPNPADVYFAELKIGDYYYTWDNGLDLLYNNHMEITKDTMDDSYWIDLTNCSY